jgi:hypothetical protein
MKKGKPFAKRMVCKALGKANCEDDSERSELAIPKRMVCKALGKANCEDVDAVDKSEREHLQKNSIVLFFIICF